MSLNYAFDVFLHGKKIDTVFYSQMSGTKTEMENDVKRSLVNHDDYDPDIKVRRIARTKKNPYPHEWAVRGHSPRRYIRFRRQNDKFGKGIHAIWGVKKSGLIEVQALRFDKQRYKNKSEVTSWLRKHGINLKVT